MRTPIPAENPPARPLVAGDFARLRRDEPGPFVTAFAGEWGKVIEVHRNGTVDLLLAGHSRPRTAPAARAMGLPASLVERCDAFGRPPPAAPRRRVWGQGDHA